MEYGEEADVLRIDLSPSPLQFRRREIKRTSSARKGKRFGTPLSPFVEEEHESPSFNEESTEDDITNIANIMSTAPRISQHFEEVENIPERDQEKEYNLRTSLDSSPEQERLFPNSRKRTDSTSSTTITKAQFKKGSIIKLNVGGTVFQTTWDTLTKYSDSMLSAMFAGKIPVKLEDGYVFIDRDGKHFKKILSFLRNGSIDPPASRDKCIELLREAQFYQLGLLAEQLQQFVLEPLCGKPHVGKQVTVIKTDGEKDLLLKKRRDAIVILEVSSSSFGEEKDAIIYKHLVLFDKLSSDYGDKVLFVKQIAYAGKEWKFYSKGKLQHSVPFYNQFNGKHSFQEETILDRILKLILHD